MTKTLNHIIFFFVHQNQNIFFSNIGNQNIFLEKNHKTKDRVTRTPLKLGVNFGVPEEYEIRSSHVATVVFLLLQTR